MNTAAGILFLTDAGEVLLLKRGNGGDYPGAWCFPGGSTEGTETPEETATREAIEELGSLPDGSRVELTRRVAEDTDYTTFLQRVGARFEPTINGEHTGFAWVTPDAPHEPLHPGCRVAIDRMTMDELGVARAMAAGELTSPQRYMNMWLFDIRITGTGHAYRGGIEEHVWRDPSLYLTGDFLARCNGLSVIWVHPKGSMLNSEEYANRNIGSIMLPYIKGEDVWGIAKIYDEDSARDMATQDLSTSPGVILGGGDDIKTKYEDGSVLLQEGKPTLLDHIAIVPAGVWDKGGDPSGIRTDSVREPQMAEETESERKAREVKDAEEQARKDAEGSNIDKILSHLDAMTRRMDAMEADAKSRRDAEEKSRKDAEEVAMADAKSRRDAEREAWMKEDAAECARDDADEEKECKEREEKGEKDAAESARKGRRARMDKRRADARVDAETRASEQRNHQVDIAALVAAEMAKRTLTEADRETLGLMQSRADGVYMALNQRAPAPMVGEASVDYEIRLAKGVQPKSKKWKDVNLGTIPMDARGNIIAEIYNDAVAASHDTSDLPEGQLIPTTRTEEGGHRVTTWRGNGTFFSQFKRPSLRATGSFHTDRRN